MKQACSLESMVDAVLSEMKRRGNAKNTIERHERAYSQFYEYALTQGENSYSKVLARSFLEEKEKLSAYRGPRFMEQYRIALNKLDDIAKGQDIRLRHLENGYHLKSSCFDWVIPFFEERLKRRLKNTYDVTTDGDGYMKYAGNELEYTLSDLSVHISNNAIASGRSEGYLATATLHLEVPTRFAGRVLPPVSLNLQVQAKYIPKF